jgi:ABC-type branched-subunit amino acid transport system substrate-binding protein
MLRLAQQHSVAVVVHHMAAHSMVAVDRMAAEGRMAAELPAAAHATNR